MTKIKHDTITNEMIAEDPYVDPEKVRPYTKEEVGALKREGKPRPKDCSTADWNGPRHFNERHNLAIIMASYGHKREDIAAQLEVTKTWVNSLLDTSEAKTKVARTQDRIWGKDVRKRIESMLHKSLDTLETVLNDEKEQTKQKVDVAKYLLDQGIGKSKQEVHHSGSFLSEIMHRFDNGQTLDQTSRDVSGEKPKLEMPKDALDTFAEDFAPAFKVGEKSSVEEESDGEEPGQ